ncbi:Replication protein [Pseudomonas marincola]|uniref:Replication protein n=1 Tax=Pseudomonas marincola TaxID=437900 RepID=A0A653E862_9PSED|nr:helix-turn-helix domain-containing protein [Pseudomonas marincola]CAE6906290.1 Replication protein [Pseudomonas marincola]
MSFQAMAWAVDLKLPMREKFVLLMLANRTNHDTGRCDPSHKRIAEDCGMSVSSVKRAIQVLEDSGFLVTENRSANSVKLPNQYRLCLEVGVGSHRPDPVQDEPTLVQTEPTVGSRGTEGVGSHRPIKQESFNQELNPELNLKELPAAASATGLVVIEGGKRDKPRVEIPADMPGPKDQSCKTFRTWANYAFAYRKRYSAWPVWNAKVGGQVSQLIDRLGAEVAPQVAAFYLGVNDARLISDCHSLNGLLAKAESLHTQWVTGRQINGTTARQMESTQANINAAQEASSRIIEKGVKNAFL